MVTTMAEVARDYVSDGIPPSGKHKIKKKDLRAWGGWVEQIITAFTTTGAGLVFSTRELLYSRLDYARNTMAWVIGDPTTMNNGVYRKNGNVGEGDWIRMSDLPFSFIVASNVGAGSANAITAATSMPVSSSALVLLNIAATNSASPVTVSFNGGPPLTIKTSTGNDVAVGGLITGMMVLGVASDTTFRLVSDQASAAIVAMAEAAAVRAEQAAGSLTPATVPEAQLGSINTRSMTPSLTKASIESGVFMKGSFGLNSFGQMFLQGSSVRTIQYVEGEGFVLQAQGTAFVQMPAIPRIKGRKYFIKARIRTTAEGTVPANNRLYVGVLPYLNTGAAGSSVYVANNIALAATAGFQDYTGVIDCDALPADVVRLVPRVLLNYNGGDGTQQLASFQVDEIQSVEQSYQIGGSGSNFRTDAARFGDTFDIEEYLTGDGVADNTAALALLITYMAANPKKVYRSKPGRVFRVLGGGFVFPDNITLNTEGAKFQLAANLSASATPLITGLNNRIDALIWEAIAGVTLSRGVAVKDGSQIGTFQFTSVDQQANSAALFNAGLRLDGSDITIQEAIVSNFDNGLAVYADGASGIRESISIKSLRVKNYLRGMYARNIRGLSVTDFMMKGRSPNARPDPGHNGILLEGVEFARLTNGSIRDSGEHALRSGGFRDASAGTGSYISRTRQLTISTVQIENAGQSGVKIWSGAAAQQHRDVVLNSIQCVDCGDDGEGVGFNDTGFMLQNIDGLTAANCSISARNRSFAAYDGYILHGITNGVLTGCRSAGVARNAMRFTEYSDDVGLDSLPIQYVDVSNFQGFGSTEAGVHIKFTGTATTSFVRDLMITNAHIIGCTNGIETTAVSARFAQPSYVSAFVRGNTGARFAVTATASLKTVDLAA